MAAERAHFAGSKKNRMIAAPTVDLIRCSTYDRQLDPLDLEQKRRGKRTEKTVVRRVSG